jgi:hypothetical protein
MNQPWGEPTPGWDPPAQPWGPTPPAQQWGPPPPGQSWGAPPAAGPSVGWAVALWLIAAGCLGGALLCGVLAVVGFTIDNHMANNGVTTTATVTEVNDGNVSVDYTTESDVPASAEFTWWPDEYPAVDDEIEITYDPDNLSYAVRAGSNEDQLVATGLAVGAGALLVVAVGTGVGALLIHRARAKAARSAGFSY